MLADFRKAERFSLAGAFGLYSIAFLALGWPWLSGTVEIPYDAASQFYPQFAFLARSFAAGQSPFWTPHIFAGSPQIADPQSLIFSPLHVIAALLVPNPSPWFADVRVFVLLYAGGAGIILFFRERGWHIGGALVAALAFSFGGSAASRIQHIGQVESLVFLPLALWMLARALERSSWRAGAGAGVIAACIVLGRDQVSLIAVYLLTGFVFWHWLSGPDRRSRIAASMKPLIAGAIAGAVIVTVPVMLTALLALHSNRPDIGFAFAAGGSLHPANLLMLVLPDLFGASDFDRELWGPPGFAWHDAFGPTDLAVAQNVGQIYVGALVAVVVLGFGVVRGLIWTREIRFFTVAMVLTLLYALGKYTPVFHWIYDFVPGVRLYRRPADATFVFCALLALLGGYLVHRFLTDAVPAPRRWQRAAEIAIAVALIGIAIGLALWVGTLQSAALPILWGAGFAAVAIAVLASARRLAGRSALAAAALLVGFTVADLAWNNAPNESTGLKPSEYEALRSDTGNETVALLKSRLEAAAAPDRRDRVELIGVAYHWPNIGLIHDFDHLFGHNPLRLMDFERATAAADTVAGVDQRQFSPLMSSYRSTLENLFGVRFIAIGVPVEQIDRSLKPGDLDLVARTKDAYVYENPRALPRVMLATEWRKADFEAMIRDGGWPDVDPRRTVLLENAPATVPNAVAGGTAHILRYQNTDIEIEADAPGGGFVVLNDVWHPWWRASVDDKPAEILKANVLFRAVAVPPGRHVVRFTFHPFSGAFAELREMISGSRR
jgi:hypothetical protein